MRRPNASHVERSWKSVFRWPVFLLANIAVLLLVGISTLRESVRGWTVDHEIRALEAQAETLEGRKLKLMVLTQSLTSPERVEFEARSRLGWKKEGERVVVLTGYPSGASSSDGDQEKIASSAHAAHSSHLALWWKYFAGN